MPLVSVIVPIYNAEKTIARCLANLVHQSLTDIEILLVDDASVDGTLSILEACEREFPEKVRLFRQMKNAGPGVARNLALKNARGSWIGFVDADDMVDVSMYEKLYKEAVRTDADIVDAAFYREAKDLALQQITPDMAGKLNAEKKSLLIASGGYTVSKLFRKDLLLSMSDLFRPVYMLEDMDFLIEAVARARSVASIPEVLYIYKETRDSLSSDPDLMKFYASHLGAMAGIYDRLKRLADYEDYRMAAEYAMIVMYSEAAESVARLMPDEAVAVTMIEQAIALYQATIETDLSRNPFCMNPDKMDHKMIHNIEESLKDPRLYFRNFH